MNTITFPESVRCKGRIVTIYHSVNRGKDAFTLSYYDGDGLRQRRMFRDYATTRQTAKSIAETMAEGGLDVLTLSGKERMCYERALEVLRPLGLDIDTAALQLVE